MSETIMCVEDSLLQGILAGNGFIPFFLTDAHIRALEEGTWFAPRHCVENQESFRQIVPYVILRHGKTVATYRRTPKGDERRLHGKLSIGIGGHVSLHDLVLRDGGSDFRMTVDRALTRELEEEVSAITVLDKQELGFIYDDREPVSRVHLGIVSIWTIAQPHLRSNEDSLDDCHWTNASELQEYTSELEGWSVLCSEAIQHSIDAPK